MPKLNYQLNPDHVSFPPITTVETTVTGEESWRTAQRTPAHYGVKGGVSVVIPPISEGKGVIARRQLSSLANPQLVYALGGTGNG